MSSASHHTARHGYCTQYSCKITGLFCKRGLFYRFVSRDPLHPLTCLRLLFLTVVLTWSIDIDWHIEGKQSIWSPGTMHDSISRYYIWYSKSRYYIWYPGTIYGIPVLYMVSRDSSSVMCGCNTYIRKSVDLVHRYWRSISSPGTVQHASCVDVTHVSVCLSTWLMHWYHDYIHDVFIYIYV